MKIKIFYNQRSERNGKILEKNKDFSLLFLLEIRHFDVNVYVNSGKSVTKKVSFV